jgi:hypothetical protein
MDIRLAKEGKKISLKRKLKKHRRSRRQETAGQADAVEPLSSRHYAVSLAMYLTVAVIAFHSAMGGDSQKSRSEFGLRTIIENATAMPRPAEAVEEIVPEEPVNPLEEKINSIVRGTPMAAMAEEISGRNKTVAAFLVGIAMKESKLGIYSPKKGGQDCFNYWGYRGEENPTRSGYSCFDTPEHAVQVVGNRIEQIVKQGAKNPSQMIVWKCGYTCAGHSSESVRKWISDVGINFYDIMKVEQVAKK